MKRSARRTLVSAITLAGLLGLAAPAGAMVIDTSAPLAEAGSVCDMTTNTFGCPGSAEGEPEALIEMITGAAPAAPMAEAGSVCEATKNGFGCPGSPEGEPEALIGMLG